tara:strand:- start:3386 stop:3862 length:477 start_codon:yes stop_codon:yes gene_type:complete
MSVSQPIQQSLPENLSYVASLPTPPGANAAVETGTTADVNAPAQTGLSLAQQIGKNIQNIATADSQEKVNLGNTLRTAQVEGAGQEYKVNQAVTTAVQNQMTEQDISAQNLLSHNIALMLAANNSGEYTANLKEQMDTGRDPGKDVEEMAKLKMRMSA